MRVIITGSNGLVGSSLLNYLAGSMSVIGLDIDTIDLTDEMAVKDLFEIDKADALVNCFAYNPLLPTGKSFLDFSLEEFNKYMNINLTSLFSVCREFIRNNTKGAIVNFSSTYGLVSPKGLYGGKEKDIAYGVSKAGVIQLTKHLAVHSAPKFRVNCIVPGGIENNQEESFKDIYSRNTPIGRMMKVKELNGLVKFLISEESSYCTGGVFVCDGGYTII